MGQINEQPHTEHKSKKKKNKKHRKDPLQIFRDGIKKDFVRPQFKNMVIDSIDDINKFDFFFMGQSYTMKPPSKDADGGMNEPLDYGKFTFNNATQKLKMKLQGKLGGGNP